MNILENTYTIGGAEYRAVIDSKGGYSIFLDNKYIGEVTPCRSAYGYGEFEVSISSGEIIGSFHCDDNGGIYPDDMGAQILHEYAVNPPGTYPWTGIVDNRQQGED